MTIIFQKYFFYIITVLLKELFFHWIEMYQLVKKHILKMSNKQCICLLKYYILFQTVQKHYVEHYLRYNF